MDNLRGQLTSLDAITGDDEEKKLVAVRKKEIDAEIEMLDERLRDIEKSYIENDMEEYLETLRTKSNAPASTVAQPTENDAPEPQRTPMSEIESITKEISETEVRLINAQIEGDLAESTKLSMSLSALKSRRSDLIEDMRSERVQCVAPSNGEVDDLKKEVSSLRTQISSLRGDILEINDFLRRIADKLDLDDDDRFD
ncbi:MAG: hypothetical protein PWR17_280 [Candidatus Methanomethylophilaceae archaeon]|nr:hypothetical protein [Candidatus Methanomethylophilaceae archaeon]